MKTTVLALLAGVTFAAVAACSPLQNAGPEPSYRTDRAHLYAQFILLDTTLVDQASMCATITASPALSYEYFVDGYHHLPHGDVPPVDLWAALLDEMNCPVVTA